MNIHYINQLNYPDIPYVTGTNQGGLPPEFNTFARAGCGVCCFIMAVEQLTGQRIPLDEGIKYAIDCGATKNRGTDLEVLLEYAAPLYGLTFELTDDIEILKANLQAGNVGVANSGGNRDGYECPFSQYGHYIYMVDLKDDVFTIFDTSFRPEKYTDWVANGEIKITEETFVIASSAILDRACDNKSPRYLIIKKNV